MKLSEQLVQAVLMRDTYTNCLEIGNYKLPGWWECDVLSVSKRGYASEFEIKTSRADFKRDFVKRRQGYAAEWARIDGRKIERKHDAFAGDLRKLPIKHFYYVTPEGLLQYEEIPEYAGWFEVLWRPPQELYGVTYPGRYSLNTRKKAPVLGTTPLPDETLEHIRSVFYYRYHSLLQQARKRQEHKRSQ